MSGHVNNPELAILVISVLVKRAGGRVIIDQKDIDAVAYDRLLESYPTPSTLSLVYEGRTKQ